MRILGQGENVREFIITVHRYFKIAYFVAIVFLFCFSVYKSLWIKGKSKAKIIILSFLTNPLFTYSFAIFLIEDCLLKAINPNFSEHEFFVQSVGEIWAVIESLILGILYLLLVLLFARIISSGTDKTKKNEVTFLYLMLNTIGIVSMKGVGNGGEMFSIPYLKNYIDILETAILFLIAWLFYRVVMKKLSELSMTNISVNWKIFTVPPAIFLVAYGVVSLFIAYDPDFSEDLNCLLVYTFTTVIIFIFIWAFHVIIKNLSVTGEIKTLSVEVMEALAHTIDAKDEYTRGHSVRVAKYSRMLAEKMELPAEQCESVYYMGLLHDIGKIGVPNEIINSPTKLTDEEYDVIKTHPGIGFDILAEMKSHPELSIGARWHHERFDGGGYPDHKTNEEIPLEARIIAVADSYDAMTSNRSYRKYMPQEKVRSEIEKNAGKQFDPDVAGMMLGIIDSDVDYVLHE